MLEQIEQHIKLRPGYSTKQGSHYIPDLDINKSFWDQFYKKLREEYFFFEPIPGFQNMINPYFGYFGYRFHPIDLKPKYFHVGIDIETLEDTKISLVTDGNFEYSGYKAINGNYSMFSHPRVKTKDGFKLFTLYMHLNSSVFKFNLAQKFLRRFGLRSITTIRCNGGINIGLSGSTGRQFKTFPHLHFQMELRNKTKIVLLDPMKVFGFECHENKSKSIRDMDEFLAYQKQNRKDLIQFEHIWETK